MGQPVATRLPWGETAGQGVTAISESPLDSNVVYAGASDGVLHWTRNGGTTWASSHGDRELPVGIPVSSVVASQAAAGKARVAQHDLALPAGDEQVAVRAKVGGRHLTGAV